MNAPVIPASAPMIALPTMDAESVVVGFDGVGVFLVLAVALGIDGSFGGDKVEVVRIGFFVFGRLFVFFFEIDDVVAVFVLRIKAETRCIAFEVGK